MTEDGTKILQEIIDRHGDCEGFAKPSICKRCPLGNKRVNGYRVNCLDYLNLTEDMTEEEVCDAYAKAAEDELFSINIEQVLSED